MVSLNALSFIGQGLVRPECVLATQGGNIYVADFRGGVTRIAPSGEQIFYGGDYPTVGQLKPNGICLLSDGSFLIAHLGADVGGVFKIDRQNRITPYVTDLNGKPLPPSNFIYLDHQGRLWLTVSTRQVPRAAAYRSDVTDGFICLIENGVARIVADDIGYTNEVYVHPAGHTLYVNATFSRETLAFDITVDNQLIKRRVIAKYGKGIYPDGLTMDSEGALWVTSIISNSLLKLDPASGQVDVVLQDADAKHVDWVELAYENHALDRSHLDGVNSKVLQNVSSMAFAGEQLDQMVLGCLLGDRLATLPAQVPGIKPAHWYFDRR